jgi:putative FmdB family regulatory protein
MTPTYVRVACPLHGLPVNVPHAVRTVLMTAKIRLTVNKKRTVYYALLTATVVAALRIKSAYAPSLLFEFLSNRLIYSYEFVATAVVCLVVGMCSVVKSAGLRRRPTEGAVYIRNASIARLRERSTQMPVYEYVCRDCQQPFEITRPIADAPATNATCPACGSARVDRTYSQVYAKTSRKS